MLWGAENALELETTNMPAGPRVQSGYEEETMTEEKHVGPLDRKCAGVRR